MLTGMEWAQYTWGAAWSNDPKQLGTALCMLTYFAYWVLRSGIKAVSYTHLNTNLPSLLKNRNAQCYTFAQLFAALIKIQGVNKTSNYVYITPKAVSYTHLDVYKRQI